MWAICGHQLCTIKHYWIFVAGTAVKNINKIKRLNSTVRIHNPLALGLGPSGPTKKARITVAKSQYPPSHVTQS